MKTSGANTGKIIKKKKKKEIRDQTEGKAASKENNNKINYIR